MNEQGEPTVVAEATRSAPPSAGAMLRAGREAAGLTLDDVAQQLKLAPRQVVALEENDYAGLPGRTFVRGFMRNYARLVRVDADAVLAALAGGDAPTLDSPALHPTAPTIGELPTSDHAKPGWARWAIPITLVAVIATAGVYEFLHGRADPRHAPASPPPAAEPERAAPAKPAAVGGAETQLANPLAARDGAPASGAAAPGAAEATVVLTFGDSSWVEVKDATGNVLLAQMVGASQSRTVAGIPPLDVTIGNAAAAAVTFGGQPVDLAPYTRQNVAHVVLQ